MIRVFVCPECGKTRVVSKFLRAQCYQCGAEMCPCETPYVEWVELATEERERIAGNYRIHKKINDNQLKEE